MQILLCVKQVLDDFIEIYLDREKKFNLNGVSLVVNVFDIYVLELVVCFVEVYGGNVSVLIVGVDDFLNILKNCFVVGVNEVFLVKDDLYVDLDVIGIVYVLVDVIYKIEIDKGEKFDLIFCGKEFIDEIIG